MCVIQRIAPSHEGIASRCRQIRCTLIARTRLERRGHTHDIRKLLRHARHVGKLALVALGVGTLSRQHESQKPPQRVHVGTRVGLCETILLRSREAPGT